MFLAPSLTRSEPEFSLTLLSSGTLQSFLSHLPSRDDTTAMFLKLPKKQQTLSHTHARMSFTEVRFCAEKKNHKMISERTEDNTRIMIPFYIMICLIPLGGIFAMCVVLRTEPPWLRRLRENNEQARAPVDGIELLDVLNSSTRVPPRPRMSTIDPRLNYDVHSPCDDVLTHLPTSVNYQRCGIPSIITSNRPIPAPRPIATPPGRQWAGAGHGGRQGRISNNRFQTPTPQLRQYHQGFARVGSPSPTSEPRGKDPFADPTLSDHDAGGELDMSGQARIWVASSH